MQIKNFSTSITFALGTLVLLASNVAAHGHLTSPPIRIAPGDENQGLTKTRAPTTEEPCQGVPFQGVKTQFTPGQTFPYSWEIGAAHQGTCFMKLSTDNGATFKTIKEDPHCADSAGTFNDQATLPSDVTCDQCIMQWRWEAKLTGELYLNCADVSIGGGGGGSTGSGDGSTGSGDGSTGSGAGTTDSGNNSTDSGNNSTGSGDGSTGSGAGTTGSGDGSTGSGAGTTGSDNSTTSSGDGSDGNSTGSTSGSDGSTSGGDGSTGGSGSAPNGEDPANGGDEVPPEVPTVDPNGNTTTGVQMPSSGNNTAGADPDCPPNKTSGMRRRFSPRGQPLRLRRGD